MTSLLTELVVYYLASIRSNLFEISENSTLWDIENFGNFRDRFALVTEFYYLGWIFLKATRFTSGIQTFFFSFLNADHLQSFVSYEISFMDYGVAFEAQWNSAGSAERFGNDVVFALGWLPAFKTLHGDIPDKDCSLLWHLFWVNQEKKKRDWFWQQKGNSKDRCYWVVRCAGEGIIWGIQVGMGFR